MLVTRSQILCRNVHNAVSVYVKSDFDLGNTSRCRGDSDQLKSSECFVADSHSPFTLKHVNLNRGLAISRSRKNLRFLGRNGGILLYQFSEYLSLIHISEPTRLLSI